MGYKTLRRQKMTADDSKQPRKAMWEQEEHASVVVGRKKKLLRNGSDISRLLFGKETLQRGEAITLRHAFLG